MAPRRRNGGEGAESQAVHTLGVRGRKTGLVLSGTGEVDEEGFAPMDIFSSPHKGGASTNGGEDDDDDDDDAGSEEMELADPSSAGPGPRTLLKNQRNLQYPIPRSRSPVKTGITSPARRNRRVSSPLQEDRDATVTRKLNFAEQPRRAGRPNGANGVVEEEGEDEDEEEGSSPQSDEDVDDAVVDADDGMDMVDDEPQSAQPADDDEEDPEEEEQPAPVVVKAPLKGRGRPKKTATVEPEQDVEQQPPSSQKKRGRPPKKAKEPAQESSEVSPASSRKRRSLRNSMGDDASEQAGTVAEDQPRQPKRQKTQKQPAKPAPSKPAKKSAATTAKSEPAKPRGRPGRKPKQADTGEDAGETSFMALQKGPPMPKRRGLVSVKRPDEIHQTRSGRHSYRPLHWWAGEQVIAEEEEQRDMFTNDRGFVLESMKEIRRVEEEDTRPSRKAPRSKGRSKASKPRMQAVEEEPELEEWETNPGTVISEVIAWEPEYETHPPGDDDQVHISEEQIAISADAVQTREIRDATFKFGKTLTMPFMGAGVVDLPPGSEKRPKNSRKMHMVFFVHYGKVAVTVNEGQFRISAGGQWFVPRGNYYSITNDYEQPARIFFSQACEVASQNAETSQLMAA